MKAHRQKLLQVLQKVRDQREQLRKEPHYRPIEQREALDALKEQGRSQINAIHEQALREVAAEEDRNRQYRRDHDRSATVDALTIRWAELMLSAHLPLDVLPLIQTREQAAAIRVLAPAKLAASMATGQLTSTEGKATLAEVERACELRERDFIDPVARHAREQDDKLRAEVDGYLDLKALVEREVVDGLPITPVELMAHGLKLGDLGVEQE